jgi:hypothetical protein
MDTTLLAQSLGTGLAAGMVIMAVASIILIPASYMMNRFIYHNAFMRLLIGILSGAGSFFVFLFLIVKRWRGWSKAHYFGLIPLRQSGDGTGAIVGKMAFVTKIVDLIMHPLTMFYTGPADKAGYEAAITQGLRLMSAEKTGTPMKLHGTDVTVKDGTVSEEFFEAARNVATITKKAGWTNQFEDGTLTTIGKALYGE